MTRSYFLAPIALAVLLLATACNPQKKMQEHHQAVYKMAIDNRDYIVATEAVYSILAIDTAANKAWKDTLIVLYFNRGAFAQAAKIGEEQLVGKPKDTLTLERTALAHFYSGNYDRAKTYYEQLYQLVPRPYYLYQVAALQFQLQRYPECEQNIARILSDPKAGQEVVEIKRPQGVQGVQVVPVLAAAYNVMGMLALTANKKDIAVAMFNKALEVFPKFEQAVVNLQAAGGQVPEQFLLKQQPK